MNGSDWQLIFLQSRINGCDCNEVEYHQKWDWPKSTWLANRLAFLRIQEAEGQDG
jgi:hypothetical protein